MYYRSLRNQLHKRSRRPMALSLSLRLPCSPASPPPMFASLPIPPCLPAYHACSPCNQRRNHASSPPNQRPRCPTAHVISDGTMQALHRTSDPDAPRPMQSATETMQALHRTSDPDAPRPM